MECESILNKSLNETLNNTLNETLNDMLRHSAELFCRAPRSAGRPRRGARRASMASPDEPSGALRSALCRGVSGTRGELPSGTNGTDVLSTQKPVAFPKKRLVSF